ncbi:MAG: 4'-phosphopantetheinyl transferase superfamily protein, partial [Bacteroidales bacterium]|nr:4'-phosphopantetheinyl transferase superfamily protein [Bacteroidales bacterium]
ISNQTRKLQWLGCRMALSHLLQTPRIGIRYDPFGKPFLASGRADISFAHTGKLAAAICSSTNKVGIDLEQVREKITRVASRFLTPEELEMTSGKDHLEIMTLFWAAKETLYKINGKPDLDIQSDLCIGSFDYLCLPDGKLSTRIRRPVSESEIPVSYHLLEDTILTWAAVPVNT